MDPSTKAIALHSLSSDSEAGKPTSWMGDALRIFAAFVLDGEGRLLTWNPASEQMYGYAAEEIRGQSLSRLQSPQENAATNIRESLDEALAQGDFTAEAEQLRKDGSTFRAAFSIARFHSERDLSGPQFAVLVRDVSEKGKVEKDLQSERALNESLLESLPGMVIVIDVEGRLKRWNKHTEAITGFSADQLRNAFAVEFIPPDEREYIVSQIELTFREGKANTEAHVLTKDGRKIPFLFSGMRLEVDSSPCCVSVGVDISERKRSEAALRQSEQLFREMANTVPVVVWITDAAGDTTFINERWTQLTGQRAEDTLGQGWTKHIHPDDRERACQIFKHAAETRTPASCEYRLLASTGEFRWMLDIGHPRFGPEGKFEGHIGCVLDTTDHRRLEEQFRQAQKMEAVGQLAGGVAHDFNNLLTVITGYSEILIASMPPSDPNYPAMKAIREAGERASSLTQQLLAFSRKAMLAPRVLDPNSIVRDSEKLLRRLMGEDVKLEISLDESIAKVKVDPAQLMQVLLNLASNSRDAMPRGGALRIRTSSETVPPEEAARADIAPGPYVTIAVRDTGVGMSPDVIKHLFEPFFTTKEVGKGTGLGLAVVHGIIKESGGKIDVRSEVGVGSEFRLFLPVVAEEEEPAPPASRAKGGETILLVEDEDAVRNLAQFILQSHGYRVLSANGGAEAMSIAESASVSIDILVTDVVMPEVSGDALAAGLSQRYPRMKTLFLSGHTQDAVLRRGIEHRKVAFLQKPFTPQTLSQKVRETLDAP